MKERIAIQQLSSERGNNMEKYLFPFLLSIFTLETYLEFSQKQKEEMKNDFKKVLNGESTIEFFLQCYEINFDSETKIKQFQKSMSRIYN